MHEPLLIPIVLIILFPLTISWLYTLNILIFGYCITCLLRLEVNSYFWPNKKICLLFTHTKFIIFCCMSRDLHIRILFCHHKKEEIVEKIPYDVLKMTIQSKAINVHISWVVLGDACTSQYADDVIISTRWFW